MSIEQFVQVKEFPSISVSTSGNIKCHMPNCSTRYSGHEHFRINGHIIENLRPYNLRHSYQSVCNIFVGDKSKPYPINFSRYETLPLFVDTIILNTFVERPKDKYYIRHLDNDPDNNDLSNLKWSKSKGRKLREIIFYRGPNHSGMKLANDDYIPINLTWKFTTFN